MGYSPSRSLEHPILTYLKKISGKFEQEKGIRIVAVSSSDVSIKLQATGSGELKVSGVITDIAQFADAAALSDAFANPTTTQIGSMSMAFNGTTWDRLRSVNTGQMLVTVRDALGNTLPSMDAASRRGFIQVTDGTDSVAVTAAADAFSNPTAFEALSFTMGFNGTTWDRLRVDGSQNLLVGVNVALPTGANVIGGVTQSGTWNIGTITTLSQFPSAAALADAFANPTTTQVGAMLMGFGGTTWERLRVDASRNLLVSLNTALPTGSNVIGAVTQSGTWTVARSWTLASGTDSVASVQSGTWNIGTVTTLSQFASAAALADAFANPTTTNIFALIGGFNGTTWDRLRVDASKNLLVSLNTALPTGSNVIGAVTQSGTWNIGTVTTVTTVSTVTTLSQFASAAALSDAFSNPTTTNIGSMLMGFNGTTWDRLRSESTGILRVSDENFDVALSTRLADSTFTGRFPTSAALADAFANPSTTQIGSMLSGFNGTTWDRLRTASNAGTGKLAIAVEARTSITGINGGFSVTTTAGQITSTTFQQGVIMRASPSNSANIYIGPSTVTSAGGNAWMILEAGDALIIPASNANLVYAVAASGTQTLYVIGA